MHGVYDFLKSTNFEPPQRFDLSLTLVELLKVYHDWVKTCYLGVAVSSKGCRNYAQQSWTIVYRYKISSSPSNASKFLLPVTWNHAQMNPCQEWLASPYGKRSLSQHPRTHKVSSSSSFTIILATISSFSKKCKLNSRLHSKESVLCHNAIQSINRWLLDWLCLLYIPRYYVLTIIVPSVSNNLRRWEPSGERSAFAVSSVRGGRSELARTFSSSSSLPLTMMSSSQVTNSLTASKLVTPPSQSSLWRNTLVEHRIRQTKGARASISSFSRFLSFCISTTTFTVLGSFSFALPRGVYPRGLQSRQPGATMFSNCVPTSELLSQKFMTYRLNCFYCVLSTAVLNWREERTWEVFSCHPVGVRSTCSVGLGGG